MNTRTEKARKVSAKRARIQTRILAGGSKRFLRRRYLVRRTARHPRRAQRGA